MDVDQDNSRMNKMMIYLPNFMQGMVRIEHLIPFVKNSNNIVTIFFNQRTMAMKSETMDPFGPIEELMGDDGGTLISRTMKMELIGGREASKEDNKESR